VFLNNLWWYPSRRVRRLNSLPGALNRKKKGDECSFIKVLSDISPKRTFTKITKSKMVTEFARL
jgi:hypothetical protein